MCWRQIHLLQEWALVPEASLCDAVLLTLRGGDAVAVPLVLKALPSHIPWRMSLPPAHPTSEGPFPRSPPPMYPSYSVWLFLVHPHLIHFLWVYIVGIIPSKHELWESCDSALWRFQAWGSGPFTSNRIQIELILFFCFHCIYFLKRLLLMMNDTYFTFIIVI